MKINFVTCFNEDLYNRFGSLFFKSIYENWEPTLKVKSTIIIFLLINIH